MSDMTYREHSKQIQIFSNVDQSGSNSSNCGDGRDIKNVTAPLCQNLRRQGLQSQILFHMRGIFCKEGVFKDTISCQASEVDFGGLFLKKKHLNCLFRIRLQ